MLDRMLPLEDVTRGGPPFPLVTPLSVGHKNRPLRLCCFNCIYTCLTVPIGNNYCHYTVYRMKLKPDNCVEILQINIGPIYDISTEPQ